MTSDSLRANRRRRQLQPAAWWAAIVEQWSGDTLTVPILEALRSLPGWLWICCRHDNNGPFARPHACRLLADGGGYPDFVVLEQAIVLAAE
jgi:hypothetical protein